MPSVSRLKFAPGKLLGPNLFPIVFFGFFFLVVIGGRYLPEEYQTPLIFGGFALIVVFFAVNQAIMKYIPLSFQHIDAVFYDLEGRPGKVQQIFLPANSDNLTVEHYDAAGLFKTLDKDGVEPAWLKNVKFFMLRPKQPIPEIGQYQNVKEFLVGSELGTYDDSFSFGPRKKVAEYADSEIKVDHSFSDHADFDLLPWPLTKLGEDIPIVRLVNAGTSWQDRQTKAIKTMDVPFLSGVEGAYIVKCGEVVKSERKVNVYGSEVKAIESTGEDVEESMVDAVNLHFRRHTSIEDVYKWMHRDQDRSLMVIIGVVGILAVIAYFNANPNAGAWAQYYASQYWWLILILALGGAYYFLRMRRRRGRI